MPKIKNIEKAAERIKKAVANNERIILYGDADLDGISSVIILEETIKNLNGKASAVFFPDRENDGYGINLKALEVLNKMAPALFITLDLGIGNVKEVEAANKMGFEVLIVDHHEPLHKSPQAGIIVDPKQKDDPYPFKSLANVGITLKLAKEILGKKISKNLNQSFYEMAALGTIADMVPQIEENQEIVEEGLRSLKSTFRPGLKVLLEIFGEGYVFEGAYQKIISALNAGESVNYINESYLLLTNPSEADCKELAQKLIDKNQRKQQKIKEIIEEIERRISRKPDDQIIFEGDPAWKLVLAGPVASVILQKYGKPTFVFKKGDKESCGSVRSSKGINTVDAMKTCSDFLITFGGHAQASGFRVKTSDLGKFKVCLEKYFKENKK